VDSNHLSKPNGFYQCTVQYKIYSELVASFSKQFTTGFFEAGLFPIGKRQFVSSEE
jgi:hypothetical protein